jgi:hypothetical protein
MASKTREKSSARASALPPGSAEQVRNFWRCGWKVEAAASALAVPLDEARAIYKQMDAWRKSLPPKHGRSNGQKISQ